MQAGIKVFQALSVKDHPTIIDDKHSSDLSNVRIDNPIGALVNMEGIEKYNSVGYGNPIVAIHQLNGHIFSLAGSKLYEGYPAVPPEGYTAIEYCSELQAMQANPSGHYWLANDIDASICGYSPIATFTGILDGNGHSITGLSSSKNGNLGGLVRTNNGTIKNCSFEGNVIGVSEGAAYYNIGGIAGTNNSIIRNCRSACIVSGDIRVGGIAGDNNGTIEKCSSIGNVSAGARTGGLVGRNNSTIRNCRSIGDVSGYAKYNGVGGLIGENHSLVINCYSIGIVSASGYVGGLIGENISGTVNDSFWDTETSGQATSDGGTGKTTAQMKQQATFTNWDFDDIWTIVEGVSYPTLR